MGIAIGLLAAIALGLVFIGLLYATLAVIDEYDRKCDREEW